MPASVIIEFGNNVTVLGFPEGAFQLTNITLGIYSQWSILVTIVLPPAAVADGKFLRISSLDVLLSVQLFELAFCFPCFLFGSSLFLGLFFGSLCILLSFLLGFFLQLLGPLLRQLTPLGLLLILFDLLLGCFLSNLGRFFLGFFLQLLGPLH